MLDGALEEGHSWLKSCTCRDRKESHRTNRQVIRSTCALGREERGWERGRYVRTIELAGHAPEVRPPPTDSSGSSTESGLEVIRLGAKKQIKDVYERAQGNIISP